jgi:hypothetical protein
MARIAHRLAGILVSAALGTALASPGFASAFGTLSNFDVVNDTPGPCHGFEIELEDIHGSDVSYTFGGSYIRYGTPEVVEVSGDPSHPRVIVRYRLWNGSAWEATPVAPAGITPGGHDCYSSGPIGNYPTSGCEHYGVSLRVSPTLTTYRWLVADDPNNVDSTFTAVPQAVDLPVPVWNVAANPAGGVAVRAELEPVEEENHAQYGEPQWMKVFKIESELDLEPEDLVLLLLGADGNILPDETEVETEWKLIQSKPGNAEGEDEDADVKEDHLDDSKKSVVRRYEFYRYTGPRDPENNEAMPCVEDDSPVPPDAPVDGCSDLGDFVGSQNAAVDLAVEENGTPTPTATGEPAATETPEPVPTSTLEPTAEPTPTAPQAICVGDCGSDGAVGIAELVTLVRIALGTLDPSSCAAGYESTAEVDIALLIRAVGNALRGCPPS